MSPISHSSAMPLRYTLAEESVRGLPRSARRRPRKPPSSEPERLLLDAAQVTAKDRLLIIGKGGADILCAALRRGCVAAMECVSPPRRPERADVVVAQRLETSDAAGAAADCARRAVTAGGRVVLHLVGAGARATALAMLTRLEDYGFRRVRLRAQAEGDVLLTCHKPLGVST